MPIPDCATYVPDFLDDADAILVALLRDVDWDRRMRARLTASMGEPYDYSGIAYPRAPWHPWVWEILERVATALGWVPNNALLNLYPDGGSRMGWHADDVTRLAPGRGVAVVSLGAPRVLAFRRMDAREEVIEQLLEPGSLLVMSAEMQREWQHALPQAEGEGARISVTFRRLGRA